MILSVVIPVYNVEKYIERCILSVIKSGFSIENYEIIVIDDESPDNSVSIVKNLIEKYPQIKLIRQKNRGLGGARNTGIKNSRGDYIIFLDSDDLLAEDSLNKIEEKIKNNFNIEILEYSAQLVDEELIFMSEFKPKSLNTSLSGVEYYNRCRSLPSACNKAYKRSFLLDNNLKFKEKIYIEDFEFNTRSLFYATTVTYSDISVGQFVQTIGSITRNRDKKTKKRVVDDILKIIDIISRFSNEHKPLTKQQELFFNERLSLLVVNVFFQSIKYNYNYSELLSIRSGLIKNNLYFVNSKIRDKHKNIFRLLIKNGFPLLGLFSFVNIRFKILK